MAGVGEGGHGMMKFHARALGVERGERCLVGAECEILGRGTQN